MKNFINKLFKSPSDEPPSKEKQAPSAPSTGGLFSSLSESESGSEGLNSQRSLRETALLKRMGSEGVEVLKDVSDTFFKKKEAAAIFMLKAVAIDPEAMKYLPQFAFAKDKEFILAAIDQDDIGVGVLEYADTSLKQDQEFMLKAMKEGGVEVLEYADDTLKNDQAFILKAMTQFESQPKGGQVSSVDKKLSVLSYVPEKLFTDQNFMLQAVKIDGTSLRFSHKKTLNENDRKRILENEEICLAAVAQTPNALEYFVNESLVLDALDKYAGTADYIPKTFFANKDIRQAEAHRAFYDKMCLSVKEINEKLMQPSVLTVSEKDAEILHTLEGDIERYTKTHEGTFGYMIIARFDDLVSSIQQLPSKIGLEKEIQQIESEVTKIKNNVDGIQIGAVTKLKNERLFKYQEDPKNKLSSEQKNRVSQCLKTLQTLESMIGKTQNKEHTPFARDVSARRGGVIAKEPPKLEGK